MAKFAIESQQKNTLFGKKGGFEPQYFTLRTIKKLGDLSLQNVFNILPNLRLGVLINIVLTKKKSVFYLFWLKFLLNVTKKSELFL